MTDLEMRWKAYLLGLTLAQLPAWSQPPIQQREFLHDYARSRGFQLGRPLKPKIRPDGSVYFLRSSADSPSQSLYCWQKSAGVLGGGAQPPLDPRNQVKCLLAPEQVVPRGAPVSPQERARQERQRLQGTGITSFALNPVNSSILVPLAGRLVLLKSAQSWRILPIAAPVIDPQWSPDGGKIAYVRNHNLWVYDCQQNREWALTQGGTQQRSFGEAEFVAQEEMDRASGFCWSPDSRQLALEEADQSSVEIWHLSDPLHPERAPQPQAYPRPGRPNVKVRLGLVDLQGRCRWVKLGDEYLGSLRWDPLGPLTVQVQNRSQQRLRLLQIDPRSGRSQILQEQRSPTWVPLSQDVPLWLDGQHYLYLQQRNDRMALVRCSQGSSQMLEPHQDFDILEVLAYDKQRQAALCRVDQQPGQPYLRWVGGPNSKLGEPGVQEASYAGDGQLVTLRHTMDHLPRLQRGQQVLPDTGLQPSLRPRVQFETVEVEGRQLRAALIWPGVDRESKLPVILDIYGGPTKVQVAHQQRNWLIDQWLAEQGFLVIALDNRGTPGRGRAWESAIYGRFDQVPLHDQMAGLKALAQRHPSLDLSRVGLWGWSFGGYLAAQGVLKYPQFFRAAVAGAPVTDWMDYDSHYSERYLGLPASQPQAYGRSSLLPLAAQLERPLLLVHGSADDNVYFRHSLRLSQALLRAGKDHQLLTLPGLTHSFRSDEAICEHLWLRTLAFFHQHLRPERTKP